MYTDYDQNPSGNPRFYGIYQAKVINNADTEGRNRLTVIIPQVTGTEEIDEVDPCLPPVAPESITLPTPGTTVWIMFESGDIHHPVWLGTGT